MRGLGLEGGEFEVIFAVHRVGGRWQVLYERDACTKNGMWFK